MSDTNKDKDFRKLRQAGNAIRCMLDSRPLRRELNKSFHPSEEGKELLYKYTEKELWYMARRRHSAAHRNSAMKTRRLMKKLKKNREKRSAMKENLDSLD